jgi:hypothetical protein
MRETESVFIFSISLLLLVIAFSSGCAGEERFQKTNSTDLIPVVISPVPPTPTLYPEITHADQTPTLSYASINTKCPIPTLILNNSQEVLKLKTGFVIGESGDFAIADGYPIPPGSIIHHTAGFNTRVFDSRGKQILIVNDSESSVKRNGGLQAATFVFNHFPENLTVRRLGGNFTYFINESSQTRPCVLITITDPGWIYPYDLRPLTPILSQT